MHKKIKKGLGPKDSVFLFFYHSVFGFIIQRATE